MNHCRHFLSLFYLFSVSRGFLMRLKTLSSTSLTARAPSSDVVTILGFGSLLSERSSRSTFPLLQNFRLGRIPNYRRVFGHPASIFFQRGIASLETLEMSSLSAEYAEGHSFICSVFEVPNEEMMEDGIPSLAFLEREEEFDILTVPYFELSDESSGKGILCTASTDQAYLSKWGKERFQEHYEKYGVSTIWDWQRDSGLKPCPLYMRHCVLAAENMGNECYQSFLDDTYLVDRTTRLREYLKENPQIMSTEPPPDMVERYSG